MEASIRQQLLDQTETLHEDNDWHAAQALWQPYVAQGDLEAQFRLAYYYLFYSFDVEPNARTEMENRLRDAAERGHPDAAYWLGHLYPEGKERDALLRRAGELGSLDAQRDLGVCYATGNWTGGQDLAQAAEWYRRAAERGHGLAQYDLGFMYLLGEGVPANREEGLRWLGLAAAQGDGQAKRLIAEVLDATHPEHLSRSPHGIKSI